MEKLKKTELYVKPGRHTFVEGVRCERHVIVFARKGFCLENLAHLVERFSPDQFPVTVVSTSCPDGQRILKNKGYDSVAPSYSGLLMIPHHEHIF